MGSQSDFLLCNRAISYAFVFQARASSHAATQTCSDAWWGMQWLDPRGQNVVFLTQHKDEVQVQNCKVKCKNKHSRADLDSQDSDDAIHAGKQEIVVVFLVTR